MRFAHVDALRALAVTLVVVSHAGLGHVVPGGAGVTIFFAISGFIIAHLLLRERNNSGGFSLWRFYARRALKLLPPLLVCIVLPTFFYAHSHAVSWNTVAAQVFFAFNWEVIYGNPQALPGSVVLWSLSIEEQFYIVIALFWFFRARSTSHLSSLWRFALALVVVSTACKLYLAAPGPHASLLPGGESARIYYGTDTRAGAIAIGILTACLLERWQREPTYAPFLQSFTSSWSSLVAAAAVFLVSLVIRDAWFRDTLRYPMQATAASLGILHGFRGVGPLHQAFLRVSKLGVVRSVGLASYSIYLVHFVLAQALDAVGQVSLPVQVLLRTSTAMLAGLTVYAVVERPLEPLKTRLRYPIPLPTQTGQAC